MGGGWGGVGGHDHSQARRGKRGKPERGGTEGDFDKSYRMWRAEGAQPSALAVTSGGRRHKYLPLQNPPGSQGTGGSKP